MNQPSLFESQVCPPVKPVPYGLPYQGSKRAIANQIIQTIHSIKPEAKYFYDLFGGGATMSYMALQWGYHVFYNELDRGIYNLVTFLKDNPLPPDWWEPVSREKFHNIKNLTDPKSVAQSLCWSFSNNRKNYLWGKHIEQFKLELYTKYISQVTPGYNPSIYKSFVKDLLGQNLLEPTPSLQTLETLERLKRLKRVERVERVETSNLSFDQVEIKTPIKQTVIYLDPPYRGTATYWHKIGQEFYDLLYKYMAESPYPVFMSEYEAPFAEIATFKRRALMAGTKTPQSKTERLFWNGK